MDNPYWDSSDLDSSGSSYSSEDEDEDYDAYILQLAIQQSLEDEPPTDLPQRTFAIRERIQDERRRDEELYEPPTPPRRSRQINAMNSSGESSDPTTTTSSGTNDIPRGNGATQDTQQNATADALGQNPSGVGGLGHTAAADPSVIMQQAVTTMLAHPRHLPVVAVMMGYHRCPLGYTARMAVIRANLDNPNSRLSAEVRRPTPLTPKEWRQLCWDRACRLAREELLQLAWEGAGASGRSGSKPEGPPHKKPRRE